MAAWSSTRPGPSAGGSDSSRGAQRCARDGVHLAGDAVDRQAVGPVGGDLQLQHDLRERQHLGQRRAGGDAVLQHHDPGGVVAQAQLGLGQDHPVRLLAAQARRGQRRARRPGAGRPGGRRPRSGPTRRWARRRRSGAARRRRGRRGRRAGGRRSGAATASRTRPTRNAPRLPLPAGTPRWWTASTMVPVRDRRSASSSGARPGSTCSRSHGQRHPHANCSRKRRSFS